MRTPNDVLRSLGIYVASSLGDEWEVRFADEEGTFRRPYVRVQSASPLSARVQNIAVVECRQTFAIVAYPQEVAGAEAARLEAGRATELLFQAFAVGTREDAYGHPNAAGTSTFRRAHPKRVPIWDCDGIPLDEPVPDDNRDPRDFASVEADPQFGPLEGSARDDEMESMYVVAGEVRLRWTRAIGVIEPATPVDDVTSSPQHP